MKVTPSFVLRMALATLLFGSQIITTHAAEPPLGSVRGRVLNAATGNYVYNAQITVAAAPGSPRKTSSDAEGYFRLGNLPVGEIAIEVSYTGLPPARLTATVPAKAETELTVLLGAPAATSSAVLLDALTVRESKEMSGTALAVNSQRFAANTRSVVAADELGFTGDGSIANAMKFLPGVELEVDPSGYGNGITLSGAPSANVPVTYGGFALATSADAVINAGTNPQRTTQLMQLSLTNISRIEINRSPTPDTPGSALAGSVNFVPKSAFERARPHYLIEAFLSASADRLTFSKSSGPFSEKERQIYPGASFSAIVPLSKHFGFTLTASRAATPKSFSLIQPTWTANWDSTTNSYFPTPANPDHYLLNGFELDSFLSLYTRNSINLTVDYKLTDNGNLRVDYTQGYNALENGQRQVRWVVDKTIPGRAGDMDLTTSTLTKLVPVATPSTRSTILNNTYTYVRSEQNQQLSLRYTHKGKVWSAEIGGNYGSTLTKTRDLDRGSLFSSLFNLTGARIGFDGIGSGSIAAITATRNGVAVTPLDLRTFAAGGNFTASVVGATPPQNVTSSLSPMRTKPVTTRDLRRQVVANVARSFEFALPTTIKLGLDYSEWRRDQKMSPFLGTNGSGFVYNGTDVPISAFLNQSYDIPLPGGFGVPTSVDNTKLAQFFQQNTAKLVQLSPGEDRRTAIFNSKLLNETIAAPFLRLDTRILNRLLLVYGVRYERTVDQGQGPFNDPTLNYRRNAAGQFVDTNNVLVGPGRTPALIHTVGSVAFVDATWFERRARASKTSDKLFPSLNANFDLTENIVVRGSYSTTIGRPDVNNIIPGYTLPDLSRVSNTADAASQLRLTNPNIKPWTSQNLSLSVEYYSKNVGDVTLRAYRRFVRDAFYNAILSPDEGRPYLSDAGLDPALYGDRYVSTLVNISGGITTSGLELSSRYQLDSLLPGWARGFTMRGNVSRNTITGGGVAGTAFGAQNLYLVPYSAGLNLTFERNRIRLGIAGKWSARQRLNYIAPSATAGVDPGTYNYNESYLRMDLDASYRLTRAVTIFINGRDINGYTQEKLRYSAATPALARLSAKYEYEPLWTLGLRANY